MLYEVITQAKVPRSGHLDNTRWYAFYVMYIFIAQEQSYNFVSCMLSEVITPANYWCGASCAHQFCSQRKQKSAAYKTPKATAYSLWRFKFTGTNLFTNGYGGRITSYNVCYTKLLRHWLFDFSLMLGWVMFFHPSSKQTTAPVLSWLAQTVRWRSTVL